MSGLAEFMNRYREATIEVSYSADYFRALGDVHLDVLDVWARNEWERDNAVLSYIYVPPHLRRQGYATGAVSFLTKLADECDVQMSLCAVPLRGSIPEKLLRRFYEGFGFRVSTGVRMVRPSNHTSIRMPSSVDENQKS